MTTQLEIQPQEAIVFALYRIRDLAKDANSSINPAFGILEVIRRIADEAIVKAGIE